MEELHKPRKKKIRTTAVMGVYVVKRGLDVTSVKTVSVVVELLVVGRVRG